MEGSPVRALKIAPPFDHYHFIDMDADNARAVVGGITAWHAIGGATVPLDTSTYEEAAPGS